MLNQTSLEVRVTNETDQQYAELICSHYKEAAKDRDTGIAQREIPYIQRKIYNQDAIIAFYNGKWAGFCYLEIFEDANFVVHSGLIALPEYRGLGIGKKIKQAVFQLSKTKYPDSKIFGITTSIAVMKINLQLGYKPVNFSDLTDSEVFWAGCKQCANFDILTRNNRKRCLCLGMLYDSKQSPQNEKEK